MKMKIDSMFLKVLAGWRLSEKVISEKLGYRKTIMPEDDEWFEKVCESYSNPPVIVDGKELPGFPSDEIQVNTTGAAGIATLKDAYIFYQDCSETFKQLGVPINAQHNLLDFGVGWGRIARFFLRELPIDHIYGLDVMEEFVQICKDTFRNSNFATCGPFPPTAFPDGKMNYIVGYSVFSHLSEAACAGWMQEFSRILVPGGLIALTTRGRPFFDYCQSMQGKGYTGHRAALAEMFVDFNAARARYDKGEFVHSNNALVSDGGVINSDFYGETFIPESYAKVAYSEQFMLEEFLYEPSRQTHPIMFFRKK